MWDAGKAPLHAAAAREHAAIDYEAGRASSHGTSLRARLDWRKAAAKWELTAAAWDQAAAWDRAAAAWDRSAAAWDRAAAWDQAAAWDEAADRVGRQRGRLGARSRLGSRRSGVGPLRPTTASPRASSPQAAAAWNLGGADWARAAAWDAAAWDKAAADWQKAAAWDTTPIWDQSRRVGQRRGLGSSRRLGRRRTAARR